MGIETIKNAYKFKIGRHKTHITTYENMQLQTTQPIKKEKPKKIKPSIPSDYAGFNYYNRVRQRRKMLEELCYNNFAMTKTTMLTLTFNPALNKEKSFTDISTAHHEFKKFIQRVNDHYDNFKYAATFSRQSNGNWHYHVLCNFAHNMKNDEIQQLWKNGITYITYIDTASLFKTEVKYLISNMNEVSGELNGKRGYLCAKSMERDIVITSWRSEHEKDFEEAFEKVNDSPRRILYETRSHLGIRGKQVNEETGEEFEVTIPDMEINSLLEKAGYESWDTIRTHLTSHADFSDKFSPLLTATPKQKKFKRGGRIQ